MVSEQSFLIVCGLVCLLHFRCVFLVLLAKSLVYSSLIDGFSCVPSHMAPPRVNPQPPQSDAPDIARAIEAMVAALTQQSNAMMQQHEASMQ